MPLHNIMIRKAAGLPTVRQQSEKTLHYGHVVASEALGNVDRVHVAR
jgi:hypothetical protein